MNSKKRHAPQFPVDNSEHVFTHAVPEIHCGQALEARLVADEKGITFVCRDCGEIKDIDCGLGCNCFICEDCAMSYIED
jgi:hypothetical protein